MNYNPLPLLIFGTGLYLLIKLRFFFIVHPIKSLKLTLSTLKDKRARESLILALAGTLGVGNIFGVAVGIILGGAGSVLWLLISSLFSSVLKYAEVTLSIDCLDESIRGPAFSRVIKTSFFKHGSLLSGIYAVLTLMLALIMGGAMQSAAATELCREYFDAPALLVSSFLCILLFLAIVGGRERIGRVTSVIIPLSTVIYIILSFSVLAVNFERIPAAISEIITDALSPRAPVGGLTGFIFSKSLREGFSRGMLSNEAGAGTSSSAHSDCGIREPGRAGLMGMIEVFFDTTLLCTLTSLVILCSVPDISLYRSGAALVYAAFEGVLGSLAGFLLTLAVFVFAYSTVICWYYYGTEAADGLLPTGRKYLLMPLFLLFCLFGFRIGELTLVAITDLTMLLLSAICCATLIKSSDRIKALSERCGLLNSEKLNKPDSR